MKNPTLERLNHHNRRTFIKWATAAAATMGLDRAGLLNFLADSGGVALADTAACAKTMRSIHIVGGNGGVAWFQLLWPHVAVAKAANQRYAFHAPGAAIPATETTKPFMYAPESPWQNRPKWKVTAMMAGSNQTHTGSPASPATIAQGVGMIAAATTIQQGMTSLLPVIAVSPLQNVALQAPGAPAVATVRDADGFVGLFNSEASKVLLKAQGDANLYRACYEAFASLNRAAGLPSTQRGYKTGTTASMLLGKNFGDVLKPTPADLTRYGIDQGSDAGVAAIARYLITILKAFKLGLTSSVVIPAFNDDPHGAFNGGISAPARRIGLLGKVLNAFAADCDETPDPSCSKKSLAESIVLTVHGDTPKTPFQNSGWPDGTPGNSNWIYVMGNGFLKTGWFGRLEDGPSVFGFDPTTGQDVPNKASSDTSNAAAAAVCYAVAKGDMRRVQDFYRGEPITGIVEPPPA